jgi:3-deoxy-7-phosphoheptulonate synthase
MVIVMASDAAPGDIEHVVTIVESVGAEAFVSRGITEMFDAATGGSRARVSRVVIGVVGDIDLLSSLNLAAMRGVRRVARVSASYKLVSREHHLNRSTVKVAGVPIGPNHATLIAGPCAVETPTQTLAAARMAQSAGAVLLRGGAYKPRTSPYAFQGLGERGLRILADVRSETGMPIVTEVVGVEDVDTVAKYADMLQIGTRNMANFPLLQAVGAVGKPVMLKRGMTATIEEWLMAAEYIAQRGNLDIVLCERGIRTYEPATRNTLDISAVPVVQRLSHLPIIVDPSHSGGRRDLVIPLTRTAIVAGADGVIIDVHPQPDVALCDGPQALIREDLPELARTFRDLSTYMGRQLPTEPRRQLRTA